MQDSKMLNMLKMIEQYLIYPDNDDDFKGIIYLPIRDDAPIEVKEIYNRVQEIHKNAEKKSVRL